MASRTYEEFWKEFFQLYRSYPELWKIKSEEYKNRNKKNAAYDVLLQKFKELDPKGNLESLKYKINSIRGCYRRELKKKKKSEKSGAGTDELYTPSLWYFEELSFLEDQEVQLNGISTIDIELNEGEENEDENITHVAKKSKRDCSRVERNEILLRAVQAVEGTKRPSDDASAFSSSWEALLRKLAPEQQLFANKIIIEVLYQGALGRLDENSYKLFENSSLTRCTSTPISFTDNTQASFGQGTSQRSSNYCVPTHIQSPVEYVTIEPQEYQVQPDGRVFSIRQPPQHQFTSSSNMQSKSKYKTYNELLNDADYS